MKPVRSGSAGMRRAGRQSLLGIAAFFIKRHSIGLFVVMGEGNTELVLLGETFTR
jgi:hypothetical protein